MADHRILVLADDLTGALEVGGKFSKAGVLSEVRTPAALSSRDLHNAVGAFVVDTESRHATSTAAAQRVYQFAHAAREEGFSLVYKKTDSTLRGNIGAELAAVMEAFGGAPVFYVPAYPQMGRTVKDGSLYVHGIPVNATHFASDPFNPVSDSHIPNLLKPHCHVHIHSGIVNGIAQAEPVGVAICDGETDADVEAAALAFTNTPTYRLAAGPAGFAAHLARLLDLPRDQPAVLPHINKALIVNGSLHPVSFHQVELANQMGFTSVERNSTLRITSNEVWLIMETGSGAGDASLDFAQSLAKSVLRLLTEFPFDALIVFGGDTAYTIVDALGNPALQMIGEVVEGIPVCKIEAAELGSTLGARDRDLYLVTKAGSFGQPEVLSDIRELLG